MEHFDDSTGPLLFTSERPMSDNHVPNQHSEANVELELEIREDRKFAFEGGNKIHYWHPIRQAAIAEHFWSSI